MSDSQSRRNRPSQKEWEDKRAEIELLYLTNNWTLEEIRSLFEQNGFEATIRQYKTRLKTWGFDNKKIRGEKWKAMSMVYYHLKSHHFKATFQVPIRGGEYKQITHDLISKQMRRTNAEVSDLNQAFEILEQNRVEIQCLDTRTGLQYTQPYASAFKDDNLIKEWTKVADGFALVHPAPPPPLSSPTSSALSAAQSLLIQEQHDFHQRTVQLPTLPGTTQRVPSSPSCSQASMSHQPRLSFGQSQALITGKNIDPSFPNDFDVLATLDRLSFDHTCEPALREELKMYLGTESPSLLLPPLDEAKKTAAQWLAYYVLQSRRRQDSTSVQFLNKDSAISAFETMLSQHSPLIFPYCNWMIMVLGSNGEVDLLTEFLNDCCEYIDRHLADRRVTYGSPFHLARALWLENEAEIVHYGQQFEKSTETIRMLWGHNSPNYLVNQHYFAWMKMYEKKYSEAIEILNQWLPITERVLGDRHTVSVNGHAVLARAYDQLGDTLAAIDHLETALDRLSGAGDKVQPFLYRLLLRLATLLVKVGRFSDAEASFQKVIEFRVQYFGITANITWNAIKLFDETLEAQGRLDEKAKFLFEMNNLFDRETERSYLERNGAPAPWICTNCNDPGCSRTCAGPSSSASAWK